MSAFPTVLTSNQKSWSILLLDLIFCGNLQFQLTFSGLVSSVQVGFFCCVHIWIFWLVILKLINWSLLCSYFVWMESLLDRFRVTQFMWLNTGDARSHLEFLVTLLPCLVREVGFHANVWLLVSSVLLVHSAVFCSSSSRSQNYHLREMHIHELWRQ
jgi:hypothetical protein